MDDSSGMWVTSDDVFADFGEKVRRGYDPETVDRHLERLAAGIKELRRELDNVDQGDDESLEVMMRAGRRSVEEALEEARTKAGAMTAESEREAERVMSQAHAKANQIRAAIDDEVRRQEETIDIRKIEIVALDEEIEARQQSLRDTAAELLRLADGMIDQDSIDLREEPEPESEDPVATSDATS